MPITESCSVTRAPTASSGMSPFQASWMVNHSSKRERSERTFQAASAGTGSSAVTSDLAMGVPLFLYGDRGSAVGELVRGDHDGAAKADVVLQGCLNALDLASVRGPAKLPRELGALGQPSR